MQDKKWYTISEAAKYLGVSPDTLRRWEKAGKISAPKRTAGGARRYSKDLLDEILGGGKEEETSAPQTTTKSKPVGKKSKKSFLVGFITVLITLAILLPILFLLF
jgi:excisionase family DNA binding protein